MYNKDKNQQLTLTDFNMPMGLELNPDNRWVRLADLVPWDQFESRYSSLFRDTNVGNVAKPFRMALGSLLIQAKLGFSDRELVEEITENPYLQFFIDLPGYQKERPYDPSLLVLFRKRLPVNVTKEINEAIIEAQKVKTSEKNDGHNNKSGGGGSSATEDPKPAETAGEAPLAGKTRSAEDGTAQNSGTLILDATCVPSNIRYPQDYSLLNEARVKVEGIIRRFHEDYHVPLPRMYSQKARKIYLNLAKSKRHSSKKIRKVIRYMLNCVKRNLEYLDGFIMEGYELTPSENKLISTIRELYDQQKYMYDNHTHTVENRIVSLSQPYIRPIVRGKTKDPVEFGAKFDMSIDEDGMSRVERLTFDPYNEGENLAPAVEAYKERTGHYPERVLVDQIYRNRKNRQYCKLHGIRISGPKLGRPNSKPQSAEDRHLEYTDNTDRIEVERGFSLAKRCYGLELVHTKTDETTFNIISLSILAMNLFKILARKARFIFVFFKVQPCFGKIGRFWSVAALKMA